MTELSDLPCDLFSKKIVPLLPTKTALQVCVLCHQYWDEYVLKSTKFLNLDEEDDLSRTNLQYLHQHERFTIFLELFLEYCRKNSLMLVEKARFNLRTYLSEDATIIGRRWLELAFERGVKELEFNWPKLPEEESEAAALIDNNPVCWLPWVATFDNAKSLTSLKLDGVRFTCFWNTWKVDHGVDYFDPPPLLPSLKTLSLKSLRLDDYEFALSCLLSTCPSLEHLSLIDFRFSNSTLHLRTLTLKSLEFMHCEMPTTITMYREQADIIESFTWVGVLGNQPPQPINWENLLLFFGISLTCLKLQCVNIPEIPNASNQSDDRLLPTLKTLTLATITNLDDEVLLSILSECPSLEYVSLTDCSFKNFKCHVSSSTLKSLEVEHCSQLRLLQVDQAKNLESFTFHSLPQLDSDSKCKVIWDKSSNLKNINICVDDHVEFSTGDRLFQL